MNRLVWDKNVLQVSFRNLNGLDDSSVINGPDYNLYRLQQVRPPMAMAIYYSDLLECRAQETQIENFHCSSGHHQVVLL